LASEPPVTVKRSIEYAAELPPIKTDNTNKNLRVSLIGVTFADSVIAT
jgi:hypothetical protein